MNRFITIINKTWGIVHTLQGKLTLAFVLLVILPLTVLGTIATQTTTKIVGDDAKENFTLSTLNKAKAIQNFINRAEGDTLLMAQSPGLNKLINPINDEGDDALENLPNFFLLMSLNKLFYEEISYLDETGQQIVKVSSDGEKAWIVAPDKLQNKAPEYYFVETMKLAKGEIFVSRLDLDREYGEIVQPFKPIIRESTPVFDKKGKRRGIVVLFLLSDKILTSPELAPHHVPGEFEFLVDQDGYYLTHTDINKAWSGPFNLNSNQRLQNDYSLSMVETILSSKAGSISEITSDRFIGYTPIFPDHANPHHFWVMVDDHAKATVLAPAWELQKIYFSVLGVALLGILVLSVTISRRLSQPLITLREGAKQIEQGHLDYHLTITTGDEIESLAQAFNSMTDRLRESYSNLEQKIADRTIQLAERTLELQVAYDRLQADNNRFEEELALAHDIQQTLLPSPRPEWAGLDIVCYSVSAREIGGDFYQYYAFQGSAKYALTVGDISGKGVSAALLMAATLSQFDAHIGQNLRPAELLVALDKAIAPYTKPHHKNCGLCYVELDLENFRLGVANAGGIPPYIRRKDGQVEWLDVGGMPLGVGIGAEFGYQEIWATLFAGDLVILTSDGVAEANASTANIFGFERLEQAIANGPISSAEDMLIYLKSAIAEFVGNAEPHDDVTIVVLRVK